MAVICGREKETLPILLSPASRLSSFFLPLFSPRFVLLFFFFSFTPSPACAAGGNGCDDRENCEETQGKRNSGDGADVWEG